MNIQDGLMTLWQSTGIANFIKPENPEITNAFEQIFFKLFGNLTSRRCEQYSNALFPISCKFDGNSILIKHTSAFSRSKRDKGI